MPLRGCFELHEQYHCSCLLFSPRVFFPMRESVLFVQILGTIFGSMRRWWNEFNQNWEHIVFYIAWEGPSFPLYYYFFLSPCLQLNFFSTHLHDLIDYIQVLLDLSPFTHHQITGGGVGSICHHLCQIRATSAPPLPLLAVFISINYIIFLALLFLLIFLLFIIKFWSLDLHQKVA